MKHLRMVTAKSQVVQSATAAIDDSDNNSSSYCPGWFINCLGTFDK